MIGSARVIARSSTEVGGVANCARPDDRVEALQFVCLRLVAMSVLAGGELI